MRYILFTALVIGSLAAGFLVVDVFLGQKNAIQQAAQACVALAVVLIPHALLQGLAVVSPLPSPVVIEQGLAEPAPAGFPKALNE